MRRRLVATVAAVAVGLAACAEGDAAQDPAGDEAPPQPAARETTPAPAAPDAGDAPGDEHDPADGWTHRPRSDEDANAEPDEGPDLDPSPERRLSLDERITGELSPKSVVASGTGSFFAQNMMYLHTITVYDRDRELVETISDRVDLADFGLAEESTEVQGAPVEAAFTSDGAHAYVSNYSMYGPGFGFAGSDQCSPEEGRDDSFVYRIDVEATEIDQVIPVGSTPKYVAVTPDDRYVLVSNWCSYDLSIIDVDAGEEIERVELGRYPRGIAVDAEARTAYVAVMGSTDIAVVSLDDFGVDWLRDVGGGPRHLVLDPGGDYLYATLNRDGTVAKIDLDDGEVVDQVATGEAPRTMDIAEDGGALYVVNYYSDTLSKVATEDMSVLQEVDTDNRPIGVTYDAGTGEVWVACYSGSLMVFEDR